MEKKTTKKQTFEKDMERLEQLVQSMDDAPLDEMVDKYTEAMKLLVKCKTRLDEYRKKIEVLSSDGELTDVTE